MQRLIDRSLVPPLDNENRHFRYIHETGHWSVASTYFDWMDRIYAHRKSNNLPIPADLDAQAENQLCEQLPPEWCERTKDDSWVSTRFGLDDFLNGMKAFGRLMAGGFAFVPQAEADRRARICANCYYNTNIPGCLTCKKLADYVTGDVAKQHTAFDDRLKSCAVCKCSNQAQVHFRMEDLPDNAEHQPLYPKAFCWKSKLSPNYVSLETISA